MSDQIENTKRPKPGEDESEIIQQMRDFASSKSSISRENIVSFQKDKKPLSKFAQQRQAAATAGPSKTDQKYQQENVLKAVIQEKEFDYEQYTAQIMKIQKPSETRVVAFPNVMKLDKIVNSEKGKSLFSSQAIQCSDGASSKFQLKSKVVSSGFQRDWSGFPSGSRLSKSKVVNENEKNEIHESNVAILDSMSEEQMEQERQALLDKLDPEVVKMLMTRKRAPKRPSDVHMDEIMEEKNDVPGAKNPISDVYHQTSEITGGAKRILNPTSKYLNMKNYEEDKMEWMHDVTEDGGDKQPISFSARFDFNGELMPYDSDKIEPNEGLHHHGDEPHRPGYTLGELITLARSSNAQQASVAIQTIANVIKNERHGRFISCFDRKNILIELLEADLTSVLRIALDNHHSEVILDAAVQALSEILYVEVEENTLDFNFYQTTFNGYLQPSLYSKLADDKDFKEEASELKDIQIMKADLVLGLLRTSIVERFCYLLEHKKPQSASTITGILKILIRFARHSLSVASDLVNHEKLLHLICDNFLPLKSAHMTNSSGLLYDQPVHYALKFLRLLMMWGRNITKKILDPEFYDLGPRILCYLSIEPDMQSTTLQESLRLIVEAGRTWITCLRYGLGTHLFVEYHSVLMKHLVYFNTHLSMTDDPSASKFNYHFGVVIIEIINAAMDCAPNDEEQFKMEDRKVANLIDWSELTAILESVESCLKKWSVELSRLGNLTSFSLDLFTSIMSLYASFFNRAGKSRTFEPVTFMKQLESLVSFVLPLIIQSPTFKTILVELKKESFFKQSSMLDGRSRDPENLPSLGAIGILEDGKPHFMMKETSPFVPLSTLLDLMFSAKTTHSGINIDGFTEKILQSKEMEEYLNLVILNGTSTNKGSRSNWFCRAEVNFLHKFLVCAVMFKAKIENGIIVRSALTLLTHYQLNDCVRAHKIMEKIVFNQDFIGESLLASILESTKIDGYQTQNNVSKQGVDLSHLKDIYAKFIVKDHVSYEQTLFLWLRNVFSLPSLVLNSHGETLLPGDWQYLPLLSILGQQEDCASDVHIDAVKSCLTWVRIMNVCIGVKSAVFCYSRLVTVYLAASDLFLHEDIRILIRQCLTDILKSRRSLVFKASRLPGIDSFEEFYKELVQQFQAVSYGDSLFALMLLIPLTKGNDEKLKSALWCDNSEAIRSITLKSEDLIKPLKAEDFVTDHAGSNQDLVRAQVNAVLLKTITAQRNPLMFEIAMLTIRKACQSADDETFKSEIMSKFKDLNLDESSIQ